MFSAAHIKNFRCLRDVEIALAPLTVLLGPNASGKSSVLHAIHPGRKYTPEDVWHHHNNAIIQLRLVYDHRMVGERFYDPRRGVFDSSSNPWVPYSFQWLRLDVDELRRPNQLAQATQLSTTGGNIANVFGTLTRNQQFQLSKSFCDLVPVFSDVDAKPAQHAHASGAGFHELVFQDRWKPDVWYRANEVSDGAIMLLAFLVLEYQKPAVDLLAIEEPEHGLHPFLFERVINMLREMTTGKGGGKPTQVILATHSAELLDYVRPEEVRFFSRSPTDGSVRVEEPPVESPEWERAFEEYRRSLAAMWLAGAVPDASSRG
jgi:predicted ATPase